MEKYLLVLLKFLYYSHLLKKFPDDISSSKNCQQMASLLDEFARLFLSRQVAPPGGLQKATYKLKRNCFLHLQASFPRDLLEVSKESHLWGNNFRRRMFLKLRRHIIRAGSKQGS